MHIDDAECESEREGEHLSAAGSVIGRQFDWELGTLSMFEHRQTTEEKVSFGSDENAL